MKIEDGWDFGNYIQVIGLSYLNRKKRLTMQIMAWPIVADVVVYGKQYTCTKILTFCASKPRRSVTWLSSCGVTLTTLCLWRKQESISVRKSNSRVLQIYCFFNEFTLKIGT